MLPLPRGPTGGPFWPLTGRPAGPQKPSLASPPQKGPSHQLSARTEAGGAGHRSKVSQGDLGRGQPGSGLEVTGPAAEPGPGGRSPSSCTWPCGHGVSWLPGASTPTFSPWLIIPLGVRGRREEGYRCWKWATQESAWKSCGCHQDRVKDCHLVPISLSSGVLSWASGLLSPFLTRVRLRTACHLGRFTSCPKAPLLFSSAR